MGRGSSALVCGCSSTHSSTRSTSSTTGLSPNLDRAGQGGRREVRAGLGLGLGGVSKNVPGAQVKRSGCGCFGREEQRLKVCARVCICVC